MKKKTTLLIPAAIALVIAAGSEGVLAQTIDAAAQQGIYDGLYYLYYYAVPADYVREGTTNYGALDDGQSGTMAKSLLAGSQYIVTAQCEPNDCQSLLLHIHDPSGALVIESTLVGNAIDVSFQAVQSGNYTIGVTVDACSANPCHFGVDIYSKMAP